MILAAGNGKIVPVRAIPYVTGRAFSPHEISGAIADGRQNFDGRTFQTFFNAGYIDAEGHPHPVAHAELEVYARAVQKAEERSASWEDQIAAMSAGVFISYIELHSLVEETNSLCGGDWPDGNGLAPIAINGNPRASGAEYTLVLEGFEALTRGRRRRKATGDREEAAGPLLERDEDRFDVHWIAGKIWTTHPRMSIEGILKIPQIAAYLKKWAPNTVRNWLSQVDPRPSLSKPGRRHKTKER